MSRCLTQNPHSATVKFSSHGVTHNTSCLYEGMQGKRLTLEANASIPTSTAVTVEYNDALFLGEVAFCAKVNQVWKVEIRVKQILTGLQSLIALRSRLLGEDVPSRLQMTPADSAK